MKRNRILIALITSLLTLVSCNTEKHEHSFSSDWTSNDTAHWHQSTCEHSDVKDSYGEHKDLNYDGYCDICEYLTDLELSKHQHTFSNIYSMDATHHWHESNCGHPVEPIDKEEHQFVNGKCSKCDYLDSCSSLWTPINLDEMKEIIYNHFSTYQCIKDGELLSRIDNDEIPLMNSYGEKGTIKGISNQNIILADGSIRKVQENNSYEVISDKTNCKLFYSFLNNNIIDTSIYLSKLTDDTANFSEWDDKSGQYINDTCSLQESEIINYCSNYLFHVFDFFSPVIKV